MELEKFKDDLKKLGKRVIELKDNIGTEDTFKALPTIPLLFVLSYDWRVR